MQSLNRFLILCLFVLAVGLVGALRLHAANNEANHKQDLEPLAPELAPLLESGSEGLIRLGHRSFAEANLYQFLEELDPSGIALVGLGCTAEGVCQYSNAHVADRGMILEETIQCPIKELGPCGPEQ